jgi:hypothetical protein
MEAKIFKTKTKDGKEVSLKYNKPSQSILAKGDFVYREYFSKAIRAGIMTAAEAAKLLKDREIWNESQDDLLVELKIKLLELEGKLPGMSREDGKAVYEEIKKLRDEIDGLVAVRKNITDNTAEAVAADMRTQFYASECVVYNDSGKRVFKDLKDFLERLDEPLAVESYKQALIANYEQVLGIKMGDSLETPVLPEDKWLAEQIDELKSESKAAEEELVAEVKDAPKKRARKANS